ncbi:MAG: ABC transporter substrate-binding protein [Candidatus Caldarchaeum sp.]
MTEKEKTSVDRRSFIKYAATAGIAAVIAGAAGYFSAPTRTEIITRTIPAGEVTRTVTVGGQTVTVGGPTVTQTRTVTITTTPSPPPPRPPPGKTEVRIGVLAPLAAREGKVQENAARLAIEEINAKGGILGLPVKLVVADDKLSADTAVAEFRRLVTAEKVDVMIGGYSSGVMTATMEPMAELKTIFLADASSPAHARKVGANYDKYKYWFRITQNNGITFALDGVEQIDYLAANGVKIDKLYIIRDEHIWVDEWEPLFTELLKRKNIQVVKSVKIPRGYTEYEPLLIEANRLGAQAVFNMLAISGTGDVLARQWATLKLPLILMGHDLAAIDLGFWEKTGGACEYEIFMADGGVVQTAPPTPMCKSFIENYTKKYGYPPEAHQGYGAYDAVYLYKKVVEEAAAAGESNPFDSETLVKYLERYTLGNAIKLTRKVAFYPKGAWGADGTRWDHDLVWGDEYVKNWVAQWQAGKQYVLAPSWLKNADLKLPPWLK